MCQLSCDDEPRISGTRDVEEWPGISMAFDYEVTPNVYLDDDTGLGERNFEEEIFNMMMEMRIEQRGGGKERTRAYHQGGRAKELILTSRIPPAPLALSNDLSSNALYCSLKSSLSRMSSRVMHRSVTLSGVGRPCSLVMR